MTPYPVHKSPKELNMILVQHELGASTAGSSQGPAAVLTNLQSRFPQFQKVKTEFIAQGNAAYDTPHAKNLTSSFQTMKAVRDATTECLKNNRFPVVFSGDHSTAIGTIAGIKHAFPSAQMGVVWFDAHTDIHSPFTSHSSNLHGMPLSAATGQNNLSNQRQNLHDNEKLLWTQTQKLGGAVPMVELKNVAFIGIRDVEVEEKTLVEASGCLLLSAETVQSMHADLIFAKIRKHLENCDVIYVSFDIDCMDQELVPGTGTPVSNGPDPEKILKIIGELSKWDRVVCFEMSEVNPTLDQDGKTSLLAAKIVHQMLATK